MALHLLLVQLTSIKTLTKSNLSYFYWASSNEKAIRFELVNGLKFCLYGESGPGELSTLLQFFLQSIIDHGRTFSRETGNLSGVVGSSWWWWWWWTCRRIWINTFPHILRVIERRNLWINERSKAHSQISRMTHIQTTSETERSDLQTYLVHLLHVFHPVPERFKAWPEVIALLPALQHDSVPARY